MWRGQGGAALSTSGVAPIGADIWFSRFRRVARGELSGLESSLRHSFHLVQLTPLPFRYSASPRLDEGTFEGLLEAGDLHSAATNLIAYPSAPAVSGSNIAAFRAALLCVQCSYEFVGTGTNSGSAALACWLDYIARLPNEGWCDPASHPCLPEARYEPRQPLHLL